MCPDGCPEAKQGAAVVAGSDARPTLTAAIEIPPPYRSVTASVGDIYERVGTRGIDGVTTGVLYCAGFSAVGVAVLPGESAVAS